MAKDDVAGLIVSHKPISVLELKRLILIFDKIYFVHPQENTFFIPRGEAKLVFNNMEIHPSDYVPLYQGKNYQREEENIIDQFDSACKNDIINTIDPKITGFYKKYWLPLRIAFDCDTGDAKLMNIAKELVEYLPNPEIVSGIYRGLFVQPSNMNIYPKIPDVPKIFSPDVDNAYKCEVQMLSILARVNRALGVCGSLDFIPIFANPLLLKLFFAKIEKVKYHSDDDLEKEFQMVKKFPLSGIQYLLSRLSQIVIPDDYLNQISIKELIVARNNTFHELSKLRRNLRKIIFEMGSMEFDENFSAEVEEYLNKKFEPEFMNYQSKFYETIQNFLRFSAPIVGGAAGYGISLVSSLNPLEGMLLTGFSASVGNLLTNLTDYVSVPSKQKFKDSFSYLLNYVD